MRYTNELLGYTYLLPKSQRMLACLLAAAVEGSLIAATDRLLVCLLACLLDWFACGFWSSGSGVEVIGYALWVVVVYALWVVVVGVSAWM